MEKNKIIINKILLKKEKRVEILGDIIVPDIKPDIVNIINTNGNIYVYKKDINDGKVRFDGNIDTFVIYLADNGETRSIGATLNFSEAFEDSEIKSNMKCKDKVKLISLESKILNERKISIKAEILLTCEILKNNEIEFVNNLEELELQKLEEKMIVKSCLGENSNKTTLKENLKTNENEKIAEVLKTSVTICNLENKISFNKVLAKADANIKILYISEENKIGKIEHSIPVMTFIEIQNVADTHICETEYNIRNMLYKIESKDKNSIDVQIDFEANCSVFESKEINIIQDMYSIKQELSFSKKEEIVYLLQEDENKKIKIEERVLVEDINSIYDTNCSLNITNKTESSEIKNYEAEVIIGILFEADNRNGLNFQKIKIPFVFKSEKEISVSDLEMENSSFTVSNEYINCNIDIKIKENINSEKKINIIENVEVKEQIIENEYKMTIYFVKKGDTIWNIAKRFKVYSKNILKANNLDENSKLSVGDRLYIMR